MNIWALKKDPSIKHLLLLLNDTFRSGAYQVVNNPIDDQRAVRLCNPTISDTVLYIYTYGQQDDHYGLHIEYPNIQEANYYDTLESLENVTFEQLISIMLMKLDILPEMLNSAI